MNYSSTMTNSTDTNNNTRTPRYYTIHRISSPLSPPPTAPSSFSNTITTTDSNSTSVITNGSHGSNAFEIGPGTGIGTEFGSVFGSSQEKKGGWANGHQMYNESRGRSTPRTSTSFNDERYDMEYLYKRQNREPPNILGFMENSRALNRGIYGIGRNYMLNNANITTTPRNYEPLVMLLDAAASSSIPSSPRANSQYYNNNNTIITTTPTTTNNNADYTRRNTETLLPPFRVAESEPRKIKSAMSIGSICNEEDSEDSEDGTDRKVNPEEESPLKFKPQWGYHLEESENSSPISPFHTNINRERHYTCTTPKKQQKQHAFKKPRKESPRKHVLKKGYCEHCNQTETTEWRQGPYGLRTMCNACGTYYTKMVKNFEKSYKCSLLQASEMANLSVYYMKYYMRKTDKEGRKEVQIVPYRGIKWEEIVRDYVPFLIDCNYYKITDKTHDSNNERLIKKQKRKSSTAINSE